MIAKITNVLTAMLSSGQATGGHLTLELRPQTLYLVMSTPTPTECACS